MTEVSGSYRRNGKNIYIKQPEYKDYIFISKLWSDEETMRDIGGAFEFPENRWEIFYKKMVYPTDGKNFYCLVYTIEGEPIGEVSFHGFDSITKIARFNIKIDYRYRRRGYGEEALNLLFEYFFLEFGGEMIIDSVPTDEGVRVAKRLGFSEIGQYKDGTKMRITKQEFLNHRRLSSMKVGILTYDGMSMNDYACAHDILELVNVIHKEEIFKVFSIAFNDKVTLSNGLILNIDSKNLDEFEPDIMILPGGNILDNLRDDSELVKFVLKNLNKCKYVCAMEDAIKILIGCRALDGIMVPRFCSDIDRYIESDKIIDSNFCDNGKILLSSNQIGDFEMIISLVQKVAGLDLSIKLKERLGIK